MIPPQLIHDAAMLADATKYQVLQQFWTPKAGRPFVRFESLTHGPPNLKLFFFVFYVKVVLNF